MLIVSEVAKGARRSGREDERRMPIFRPEDAALMPIFGLWGMSSEDETETSMLVIRCRVCGETYQPSRDEIVQGPETYRLCPGCRPARKEVA